MSWQTILEAADFPTKALVLDFETYWDKDYTLSKMSTIEYVTDERFELTGLAVHNFQQDRSKFFEPDEAEEYIYNLPDWHGPHLKNVTIAAQNANFDCLILRERFGITPKYIVDTKDLDKMWDARAKHSLKVMAEKWGCPLAKGDTVQSKDLHWSDMTPEQRKAWAEYAIGDADIEAWLFKKMLPIVVSRPEVELPVANMTHQMYLSPTFRIDMELGQRIVTGMEAEMNRPIERLVRRGFKVGNRPVEHDDISKNLRFARLLLDMLPEEESLPVKAGKPTKNMIPLTGPGLIPAFAKDDEGMRQLLEHPKGTIRRLAEARQALQSWPLHIKKVKNIMQQAKCRDGHIGTPLGYHNGHTGRWGGSEKINLQNLGGAGRGGKGTHKLIQQVRHMLLPPKGYVLGIQDYSKVEAIGVAWQAGQKDLVEGFRSGADVYSDLASELFGEPVYKPTGFESPEEAAHLTIMRGFGKDATLGCGFGMGAIKFHDRCYANDALRPKFDDGTFGPKFIERVIKTYRSKYSRIPAYWQRLEKAWRWVTKYPSDRRKLSCGLEFWHDDGATFIRLPSGRTLRYPHAQVNKADNNLRYHWGHLWGGAITENVIQALCRDFIAESLLRLEEHGFWCVLTVHDEIVTFLREANAEERLKEMGELMCVIPDWAKGFPLSVEGKLAERYEK